MNLLEKPEGNPEEGEGGKVAAPSEISILPLRGTVLFPGLILPLVVGREKSVRLVEDAVAREEIIGVITQKSSEIEDPTPDDLYRVGTFAQILKVFKTQDGKKNVIVQGVGKFGVTEFLGSDPYIHVRVEELKDRIAEGVEVEALTINLKALFKKLVDLAPYLSADISHLTMQLEDPSHLANFVTSNLNLPASVKQEILEILDVKERLEKVNILANREKEVLELKDKIQSQIQEGMGKTQREYYLREQMKAIQKELGEEDERTQEMKELREKITKANMPKEAAEAAEKELDRLSRMSPAAAEYTVSRTYLDWLVDLPWSISTEDNLDLAAAKQILDEDHFNLEKVKKRILEYLAVGKLRHNLKGPILCFVGPPGVGKTSLGRSIARAIGRRFVRISLGGVRDEAEIRGHRRTYVGALPGRVIQGVKKAGSNNPIFMLDEVDKIGIDFRGDPSSALLEVLDPEQNYSFSDHYLDVPFDLSRVMFISTANILEPIPPALKDRMEVLELPGYTEEDKVAIAKQFLIPKQVLENGLKEDQVIFAEDALQTLIRSYTREAGVRNLEREIAGICRAIAKEVADGKQGTVQVTGEDISRYLGPIKFFSEAAERTSVPGVATGLAWTSTGGDILFVEATRMPGQKSLALTGQLGDVMKESAQAALSYVRSRAKALGIPSNFYDKSDIHIHVPSGAIPKDGPSAGITMFVALGSLLTSRAVRGDVAMTGEITLRGLVLPVGGIKEKVLAAKRAGITTIVLPRKNEKDMPEIPEHMKAGLEFRFISKMEEVIDVVFSDGQVAKRVKVASESSSEEEEKGSRRRRKIGV